MAQDERGYHSGYSAFGGHVIGEDAPGAGALRELGITDLEQLVAAAAIPGVRPHLEEALSAAGVSLDDLTGTAGDTLAPPLMAAFDAPALGGVLALGAMPPTPEVEEEIASLAVAMPMSFGDTPVALPASVNHAKAMPPVRQQGSRGTCVAHALTAAHEHWRIASGMPVDLSEQFLYHQIKQIDGSPNSCGTWQVKGAQVLARIGECREAVWAYNPTPPCNNNGTQPATAMADAAKYKIQPVVLQPKDVMAIKSALAAGACVGFSIAVYNSWYQSQYTTKTGRINMRVGQEPSAGGHAMCLIGYQDDASQPGGGFFILRNSWGTGWGGQCPYGAGNGTIPYAYLANEGWEAVAMPPPRRRLIRPDDWKNIPRPWPFNPAGGEDGGGEGRPSITIDTNGQFDIVIK
jgi:hypothetical protein